LTLTHDEYLNIRNTIDNLVLRNILSLIKEDPDNEYIKTLQKEIYDLKNYVRKELDLFNTRTNDLHKSIFVLAQVIEKIYGKHKEEHIKIGKVF